MSVMSQQWKFWNFIEMFIFTVMESKYKGIIQDSFAREHYLEREFVGFKR